MSDNEIYDGGLDGFATNYTEPQTGFGDGLLRMNWRNGSPVLKTPGMFQVTDESLEKFGIAPPNDPKYWTHGVWTSPKGNEVPGWLAPRLRLQVIGKRQQDAEMGSDGQIVQWFDRPVAKQDRPQGWTIFGEMLCLVPGFGDLPIVLSMPRVKTSMAMLATNSKRFLDEVVEAARKSRQNAKIPIYAFWMLIETTKVENKQKQLVIDYQPAGSTVVTPPALVLPDKTGDALWQALYVGRERLELAERLRGEYDWWVTSKPGDDHHADPLTAAMPDAGRNAPQDIDDMPF